MASVRSNMRVELAGGRFVGDGFARVDKRPGTFHHNDLEGQL
jgi:hypothetical protein